MDALWKVAAGLVLGLGLGLNVASADSIWDYEAVDALGYGTHPLVGALPETTNQVTFEGLVIAGTEDFVNRNASFAMYSIWIQDENDTKGGIQCWSGPWCKLDGWDAYPVIYAGTRVRVTGWLANNAGKVFVNDRHSADLLWSVEVLDDSVGMPTPQLISSVSACNDFDQTRTGGGELYQTRWVELDNLEIIDGTWGAGNQLTVSDGTGELTLYLSGMGDFNAYAAPTGHFSVVGVFDQEDGNDDGDFHDAYRLWVKNYADITAVPEPATMTLVLMGLGGLSFFHRRSRKERT